MSKPLILELMERFDYSTKERVAGKWIDGKTLYKKTISTKTGTNEETWSALTSGLNADNIISYKGYIVENITEQKSILPYSSDRTHIWFRCKNNELEEAHNSEYLSGAEIRIVIEYTKITD